MRTTVRRRVGANSAVARQQVPRRVLLEFVRNLGFDPNEVAALEITRQTITVTEYHKHPSHGGRYAAEGTEGGVAAVIYTLHLTDEEGD